MVYIRPGGSENCIRRKRMRDPYLIAKVCPVCGKNFMPAPYHVYKISVNGSKRMVCSYRCTIIAERKSNEN